MWQALDLEALGLTVDDVTTAAYFVAADGSLHRGHAGIGRALEHMALPYRIVGRAIQHRPISWVAAPTYRMVAKYRHKLPGATEACRID
jgi:predicted DCC family thiol-disulfide oxidoreductase YuxK